MQDQEYQRQRQFETLRRNSLLYIVQFNSRILSSITQKIFDYEALFCRELDILIAESIQINFEVSDALQSYLKLKQFIKENLNKLQSFNDSIQKFPFNFLQNTQLISGDLNERHIQKKPQQSKDLQLSQVQSIEQNLKNFAYSKIKDTQRVQDDLKKPIGILQKQCDKKQITSKIDELQGCKETDDLLTEIKVLQKKKKKRYDTHRPKLSDEKLEIQINSERKLHQKMLGKRKNPNGDSEEKAYTCRKCDKICSTYARRYDHEYKVCFPPFVYKCDCGKLYSRSDNFKKHICKGKNYQNYMVLQI